MSRFALEGTVRDLAARVRAAVGRGTVKRVAESGGVQRLQVETAAGLESDVEHPQEFGFSSRARAGAKATVVRLRGESGAPLVLIVDDERVRVTVGEGEVAIHDADGNKVHLKAGGKIEINASAEVTVIAPAIKLGDGATEPMVLGQSLSTWLLAHKHGGVTVGAGTSAVPAGDPPLILSTAAKVK